MKLYKKDLQKQQHKLSKSVYFNVGNLVMAKLRVPVAAVTNFHPSLQVHIRLLTKQVETNTIIQNLKY